MAIQWEDAYGIVEPQINAEGQHIYPFDPFFPLDVRFFFCGPYAHIRPNRHDYFELLYVESGEVIQEVQQKQLYTRAGDLFVMGSTLLHRMSEYRTPDVKVIVLYFLPELVRSSSSPADVSDYLMPFLAQDDSFPHVIPARSGLPSQVHEYILRIQQELRAGGRLGQLAAKSYLKLILALVAQYYPSFRKGDETFNRKQQAIDRLRPLFEYVDRNYADAITLEDAARIVHMSRPNLIRLFKQMTGQTFVTYLNQFRIAKAQELLGKTNESIAGISQMVGFCDQSYFGTLFRRLVHLAPREYRQHVLAAERGPVIPGVAVIAPPPRSDQETLAPEPH